MDMLSIRDYIGETGIDSRNYGNLEGMPEARTFFAQILGAKPEEVIVGEMCIRDRLRTHL